MRQLCAVALLAMAVVPACKEGDPVRDVIVPAVPDFLVDSPDVADHFVSLRKGAVEGGRIVLDIVVSEVNQPVSSLSIKLTYPDRFSRFINCTDGELFLSGQCFFSEPAPGSGEVFVSRSSIAAEEQPMPVAGEKVIARLEFLVFGVDSGAILIEGQNLGGGDASALLDDQGQIIQMSWFSGTLVGQ